MEEIKNTMKEVIDHANKIVDIIKIFEVTTASNMARVKLEEVLIWMEVMLSQTKKQPIIPDAKPENE